MRLTRVVLNSPSYDPATGSSTALRAKGDFSEEEGYSLTMHGDLVFVQHPNSPLAAVYSVHGQVKYSLTWPPKPGVEAVEPPKPPPAVQTQTQPQQPWKGKRR
jgi:hypothetical protein